MMRLILLALLLACIATAVMRVEARHRHRQVFSEIVKAENVRDRLEVEFKQLQLEQATYAESTLIDKAARERLGMVAPQAHEIVLVRP
ncbi:cell division protein FtsL [Lysobacteraceae bacterium NML95-0200]|nr:cell division protein FtsL [Xanthomonadaceae bacterium NML95-0200]